MTATDTQGNLAGIDYISKQTLQTLQNIQRALETMGSRLEDVLRTRIYVTDIKQWEEVGKVHGQFFNEI